MKTRGGVRSVVLSPRASVSLPCGGVFARSDPALFWQSGAHRMHALDTSSLVRRLRDVEVEFTSPTACSHQCDPILS